MTCNIRPCKNDVLFVCIVEMFPTIYEEFDVEDRITVLTYLHVQNLQPRIRCTILA